MEVCDGIIFVHMTDYHIHSIIIHVHNYIYVCLFVSLCISISNLMFILSVSHRQLKLYITEYWI